MKLPESDSRVLVSSNGVNGSEKEEESLSPSEVNNAFVSNLTGGKIEFIKKGQRESENEKLFANFLTQTANSSPRNIMMPLPLHHPQNLQGDSFHHSSQTAGYEAFRSDVSIMRLVHNEMQNLQAVMKLIKLIPSKRLKTEVLPCDLPQSSRLLQTSLLSSSNPSPENSSSPFSLSPNLLTPFLDVIRSEDISPAASAVAAAALDKFVSVGILDHCSPSVTNRIVSAVLESPLIDTRLSSHRLSITSSLTSSGTAGEDYLVARFKLLGLLSTIVTSESGRLISDGNIWTILRTCFLISRNRKLLYLLRSSAENLMLHTVILVFSNGHKNSQKKVYSNGSEQFTPFGVLSMYRTIVLIIRLASRGVSPSSTNLPLSYFDHFSQNMSKSNPTSPSAPIFPSSSSPLRFASSAETRDRKRNLHLNNKNYIDSHSTLTGGSSVHRLDCLEKYSGRINQLKIDNKSTTDILNSISLRSPFYPLDLSSEGDNSLFTVSAPILQPLSSSSSSSAERVVAQVATDGPNETTESLDAAELRLSPTELNDRILSSSSDGRGITASRQVAENMKVFDVKHDGVDLLKELQELGLLNSMSVSGLASSKINSTQSQETRMELCCLGFSLLNAALESGGESLQENPLLIPVVQNELSLLLLSPGLSETSHFVLSLALRCTFNILSCFRSHLKVQLESIVNQLHFNLLTQNSSSGFIGMPKKAKANAQMSVAALRSSGGVLERRELALASILEFCQQPGWILELYENFDCQILCDNLFEKIVTELKKRCSLSPRSKVLSVKRSRYKVDMFIKPPSLLLASPSMSKLPDNKQTGMKTGSTASNNLSGVPSSVWKCEKYSSLKHLAFLSLSAILHTLASRCVFQSHAKTQTRNPVSDSESDFSFLKLRDLKAEKDLKIKLQSCAQRFNISGHKSLPFIKQMNILPDPLEPDQLASYLKNANGLDLTAVGNYLAKGGDWFTSVRNAYFASFDFSNLGIVDALRLLLSSFKLPGEAQQIERLMESFAAVYYIAQPIIEGVSPLPIPPPPKYMSTTKTPPPPLPEAQRLARWIPVAHDSSSTVLDNAPVARPSPSPSGGVESVPTTASTATERTSPELTRADSFAASAPRQGFAAFRSSDTVLVLAFSIIMLNTDLHNPQVKKKMSPDEFLRNNKGINEGYDIQKELLFSIYRSIEESPIKLSSSSPSSNGPDTASSREGRTNSAPSKSHDEVFWTQMVEKSEYLSEFSTALVSSAIGSPFVYYHEAKMFDILFGHSAEGDVLISSNNKKLTEGQFNSADWLNLVHSLAAVFCASKDPKVVEAVLDSFKWLALLCVYYDKPHRLATVYYFIVSTIQPTCSAKVLQTIPLALYLFRLVSFSLTYETWLISLDLISKLSVLQFAGAELCSQSLDEENVFSNNSGAGNSESKNESGGKLHETNEIMNVFPLEFQRTYHQTTAGDSSWLVGLKNLFFIPTGEGNSSNNKSINNNNGQVEDIDEVRLMESMKSATLDNHPLSESENDSDGVPNNNQYDYYNEDNENIISTYDHLQPSSTSYLNSEYFSNSDQTRRIEDDYISTNEFSDDKNLQKQQLSENKNQNNNISSENKLLMNQRNTIASYLLAEWRISNLFPNSEDGSSTDSSADWISDPSCGPVHHKFSKVFRNRINVSHEIETKIRNSKPSSVRSLVSALLVKSLPPSVVQTATKQMISNKDQKNASLLETSLSPNTKTAQAKSSPLKSEVRKNEDSDKSKNLRSENNNDNFTSSSSVSYDQIHEIDCLTFLRHKLPDDETMGPNDQWIEDGLACRLSLSSALSSDVLSLVKLDPLMASRRAVTDAIVALKILVEMTHQSFMKLSSPNSTEEDSQWFFNYLWPVVGRHLECLLRRFAYARERETNTSEATPEEYYPLASRVNRHKEKKTSEELKDNNNLVEDFSESSFSSSIAHILRTLPPAETNNLNNNGELDRLFVSHLIDSVCRLSVVFSQSNDLRVSAVLLKQLDFLSRLREDLFFSNFSKISKTLAILSETSRSLLSCSFFIILNDLGIQSFMGSRSSLNETNNTLMIDSDCPLYFDEDTQSYPGIFSSGLLWIICDVLHRSAPEPLTAYFDKGHSTYESQMQAVFLDAQYLLGVLLSSAPVHCLLTSSLIELFSFNINNEIKSFKKSKSKLNNRDDNDLNNSSAEETVPDTNINNPSERMSAALLSYDVSLMSSFSLQHFIRTLTQCFVVHVLGPISTKNSNNSNNNNTKWFDLDEVDDPTAPDPSLPLLRLFSSLFSQIRTLVLSSLFENPNESSASSAASTPATVCGNARLSPALAALGVPETLWLLWAPTAHALAIIISFGSRSQRRDASMLLQIHLAHIPSHAQLTTDRENGRPVVSVSALPDDTSDSSSEFELPVAITPENLKAILQNRSSFWLAEFLELSLFPTLSTHYLYPYCDSKSLLLSSSSDPVLHLGEPNKFQDVNNHSSSNEDNKNPNKKSNKSVDSSSKTEKQSSHRSELPRLLGGSLLLMFPSSRLVSLKIKQTNFVSKLIESRRTAFAQTLPPYLSIQRRAQAVGFICRCLLSKLDETCFLLPHKYSHADFVRVDNPKETESLEESPRDQPDKKDEADSAQKPLCETDSLQSLHLLLPLTIRILRIILHDLSGSVGGGTKEACQEALKNFLLVVATSGVTDVISEAEYSIVTRALCAQLQVSAAQVFSDTNLKTESAKILLLYEEEGNKNQSVTTCQVLFLRLSYLLFHHAKKSKLFEDILKIIFSSPQPTN